jgi:CheY-like chemotaxis protein
MSLVASKADLLQLAFNRPGVLPNHSPSYLAAAHFMGVCAAKASRFGLRCQAGKGLEAAQDFKPQLTLCDLNLPDMRGPEVIRLIRSNRLTRYTHAVVLTAMSNLEIRELKRDPKMMGIDEWIYKPLTTQAIRTLVTKLRRQ